MFFNGGGKYDAINDIDVSITFDQSVTLNNATTINITEVARPVITDIYTANLKKEILFQGNANTLGTYSLKYGLSNFKSICIEMIGNVLTNREYVSTILDTDTIDFSGSDTICVYAYYARDIGIKFTDDTHFNIYYVGNNPAGSNVAITKIWGLTSVLPELSTVDSDTLINNAVAALWTT
jgi:hypothetical protein